MKVIDHIGKYGALRQFAIDLFAVVETLPEKEVELDFTDVVFCSRGCVQELMWQAKKSSKQITYTNRNKDIMYMFYAVEHPRPKAKII